MRGRIDNLQNPGYFVNKLEKTAYSESCQAPVVELLRENKTDAYNKHCTKNAVFH